MNSRIYRASQIRNDISLLCNARQTEEVKAQIEALEKELKEVSMVRYYDTESGNILTEEELRKEWEELFRNGETETDTFEGYIRNCTSKNGTLEAL